MLEGNRPALSDEQIYWTGLDWTAVLNCIETVEGKFS